MSSDHSPEPGHVFALRADEDSLSPPVLSSVHSYGDEKICITDHRGFSTPKGRNPEELVLDASEGFIPLWAEGVNLRWRFNEHAVSFFSTRMRSNVPFESCCLKRCWHGGRRRRSSSVSDQIPGDSRLLYDMPTIAVSMVVFWRGHFFRIRVGII